MTRRQSLLMLALPVLAMCLAALLPVRAVAQEARQAEPVSYTHLTLPTILRV